MSRYLISKLSSFHCVQVACLLGLGALSASAEHPAGDRTPGTRAVFPESAFYENGGVVIDVTRPPFNAKGDGVTDDTQAIIKAYDIVAETVRKVNESEVAKKGVPLSHTNFIIYFPDGEYLVSDTIIYSGEPIVWRRPSSGVIIEGLNKVHFVGESREGTKIRLKDGSKGFEYGQKKPVLSFGQLTFNNVETNNLAENLTIDVGSNNPGAIGIYHAGANMSTLRNLRIISEDGQGLAGIAVIVAPTMGYHSDITVEGFRIGLWMYPFHVTHNSFEYVTLKGQTQAAVVLDDSTTSLRKILVEDCQGPALLQRSGGSQAVLIDSELNAAKGGENAFAVNTRQGAVYVHNTTATGYEAGVAVGGTVVQKSSDIAFYTYPEPVYMPPSAAEAKPAPLNLPIKDEPAVSYPKTAEGWAVVDDYLPEGVESGEDVDYADAVQAALDSGKAYILFPKNQVYKIGRTLTVPASVKVINGLFNRFSVSGGGPLFSINEASDTSVVIENMSPYGGNPIVSHDAMRPLGIRMMRGQPLIYENKNTESGAELFLTNVCNVGKQKGAIRDQKVWARFIDTENPQVTNFPVVSTDMWVFGYKTEKHQISFAGYDGSRLEVLGGVSNQFSQLKYKKDWYFPFPMFLVENSEATVFACTNGPHRTDKYGYEKLVQVVEGDNSWLFTIHDEGAMVREGVKGQHIVPLTIVPKP